MPLDRATQDGRTIDISAVVVTAPGGEKLPYLVFLQGGPGNEVPSPFIPQTWFERALADYQLVLLDQRGTGNSTPVYARTQTVNGLRTAKPGGALTGLSPAAQAEYLTHLRADEIVEDCEAVREALGVEQWTVLGQSFGGFTTLRYLSVHPESLAGAIITGGLSAVGRPAEDIYSTTWQEMLHKSEIYYHRYPEDRDRMARLMDHAAAGDILLPNGDVVSPTRLRTLGLRAAMTDGMEPVHALLTHDHQSSAFSHDLAGLLPFAGRNPLYAVIHESSYADGVTTNWAAERTRPTEYDGDPTLLAGEHIHQGLFAEDSELAGFADAAAILANHPWPQLYYPEALKKADVPVAASVYVYDAFVPFEYSLETADLLPDARLWITSEWEHNGLRASPSVLDHLIGLLHGTRIA